MSGFEGSLHVIYILRKAHQHVLECSSLSLVVSILVELCLGILNSCDEVVIDSGLNLVSSCGCSLHFVKVLLVLLGLSLDGSSLFLSNSNLVGDVLLVVREILAGSDLFLNGSDSSLQLSNLTIEVNVSVVSQFLFGVLALVERTLHLSEIAFQFCLCSSIRYTLTIVGVEQLLHQFCDSFLLYQQQLSFISCLVLITLIIAKSLLDILNLGLYFLRLRDVCQVAGSKLIVLSLKFREVRLDNLILFLIKYATAVRCFNVIANLVFNLTTIFRRLCQIRLSSLCIISSQCTSIILNQIFFILVVDICLIGVIEMLLNGTGSSILLDTINSSLQFILGKLYVALNLWPCTIVGHDGLVGVVTTCHKVGNKILNCIVLGISELSLSVILLEIVACLGYAILHFYVELSQIVCIIGKIILTLLSVSLCSSDVSIQLCTHSSELSLGKVSLQRLQVSECSVNLRNQTSGNSILGSIKFIRQCLDSIFSINAFLVILGQCFEGGNSTIDIFLIVGNGCCGLSSNGRADSLHEVLTLSY